MGCHLSSLGPSLVDVALTRLVVGTKTSPVHIRHHGFFNFYLDHQPGVNIPAAEQITSELTHTFLKSDTSKPVKRTRFTTL